jgi:mono/diheme cytochrome c family protein
MNEEGGSDVPGRIPPRSLTGSEGSRRRRIAGIFLVFVVLAAAILFLTREKWLANVRRAERQGAAQGRIERETTPGRVASRRVETGSGGELYASHCAVCHGTEGNGLGQAARYLFPRPRDFGAGGLQLAGTDNGVASLEDVERVLARGMPGTSMRAFDTLNPAERERLAQEVLRLRREGARRQLLRAMREAGEEPIEDDVRDAIQRTTTPGRPIPLPDRWPSGDDAVASGKVAYQSLGCGKCHGDDGRGAADQPLFDALGEPNRARDLVHESFKGGRERESIYLRIAFGMPGTAHPAAPGLPQEELADLVEYVLSLARSPDCVLTNHQRRAYADARAYRERPGEERAE